MVLPPPPVSHFPLTLLRPFLQGWKYETGCLAILSQQPAFGLPLKFPGDGVHNPGTVLKRLL